MTRAAHTDAKSDPAGATKELKAFALDGGALVCGVADAQAFTEAPEGFRPRDLLPGARSVVVVGGNPPRAADWVSPLAEHQETMGTSDRINSLGLRMAKFIESHFGYYALFVPPGVNKGNRPFLSVAYAAVQAGCGSRSLAGPVLHREYGMLFHAAIVTTFPFDVDGPEATPACPAPPCLEMWEAEGPRPVFACAPSSRAAALAARSRTVGLRNGATTWLAARLACTPTGFSASRRGSRRH